MIFVFYRHVKEHLKEVVDKPKEQMTEEELEFHYFKLHDYDNNNKLDGVEIVKAITHFHAGKFFFCLQQSNSDKLYLYNDNKDLLHSFR